MASGSEKYAGVNIARAQRGTTKSGARKLPNITDGVPF